MFHVHLWITIQQELSKKYIIYTTFYSFYSLCLILSFGCFVLLLLFFQPWFANKDVTIMIRKVLDMGTDNNWMGNWICSRPTFSQVFEVSTLRRIKMKMIIFIAYQCNSDKEVRNDSKSISRYCSIFI